MRLIYTALCYLSLPFAVKRLYRKAKFNPEYKNRIHERFGRYGKLAIQPADIWLHAVSLGESIAATALIEELIKDHSVVITTTTPTGSTYIKEKFGNKVQHVYFPYDIGSAINSFLQKFKPKKFLIMETEIWPNVLYFTKKRGIKTAIINARISDHSVKKYLTAKIFFKNIIRNIDWIGAQTAEDRKRFLMLGANQNKVSLIPNIKFAAKLDPECNPAIIAKTELGIRGRIVWVAGSTHPEEDLKVIAAHQEITQAHANALLIIIPRHPGREAAITTYAKQYNMRTQLSSKEILSPDTNVWLVDQMGVLQEYYKLAPIAFVGGSLVKVGGHNLLEPVRAGAIVISGNELHNFRQIRDDLLQHHALEVIHDSKELAAKVNYFIDNIAQREAMQQRGQDFIAAQRHEALQAILSWVAV
jgi:3-deoxy-D-manno-octulosonic-acid transferase